MDNLELKSGQIAVSLNKSIVGQDPSLISIKFKKIKGDKEHVDMILKVTIKPDQFGPGKIKEEVGKCGIFTLGTLEQFRSNFPDLVIDNPVGDDIYIVSKIAAGGVKILTGGEKGEHGETILVP